MLAQIQERYERYIAKSREVRAKASPMAGFMGIIGGDPKYHPCHEEFFDGAGLWMQEFIRTEPDPQTAARAAWWFVQIAQDHRGEDCYWYLYAIQGHVRYLVSYLAPEECRELTAWYESHYPKREIMPVQRELLKLLKKQGKT